MLVDFQVLTVYRHLRRVLPGWSGEVLDVGCGQSPYRFLLDATRTRYVGLDIADAGAFGYANPDVTTFDGGVFPFADGTFDAVLCTEVLEHVYEHGRLVREIHRVLKPGGEGFITVPWSARFHYIPHDYFRYTPTALGRIFGMFSAVSVEPRGTDVTAIANKLVVLWCRGLAPSSAWRWILAPLWLAAAPLVAAWIAIAHVGLAFGWGSADDPLGYTIRIRK
jgi:SAM-dependent methyltransferase